MNRLRKRCHRLFQFRLRTLLLVMAVAGPLSVWCEPRVRQWLMPADDPGISSRLSPCGNYLDIDCPVDQSAFDGSMPMMSIWEPSGPGDCSPKRASRSANAR